MSVASSLWVAQKKKIWENIVLIFDSAIWFRLFQQRSHIIEKWAWFLHMPSLFHFASLIDLNKNTNQYSCWNYIHLQLLVDHQYKSLA